MGILCEAPRRITTADSRTQSVLGNSANNPISIIPTHALKTTVDFNKTHNCKFGMMSKGLIDASATAEMLLRND